MSININSLRKVTEKLPVPKEKGQVYQIALPNRVDELNDIPISNTPENKDITYRVLTLIAVPYCNRWDYCWLEWELESE